MALPLIRLPNINITLYTLVENYISEAAAVCRSRAEEKCFAGGALSAFNMA